MVGSEVAYHLSRRHLAAIRDYTFDECSFRTRVDDDRLVLGVIGGFRLLDYVRLGYDNIGPYYNPLLIFDEVHYFQSRATRSMILDCGYPMYIHGPAWPSRIVRVCRKYGVDVLRAYDAIMAERAFEAGGKLGIPVIVSVH